MKEKLFTRSYIAACITHFFYQIALYSLVPILALYLIDTFKSDRTEVGLVLACYAVSTLLIRPFCGHLLDIADRKKTYIIALVCFTIIFVGYPIASTIALFALLRVAHGLALGFLAVSANTIVIDISPSSRRGEGIGYYGIMNNLAMAIGPATAVYVQQQFGYSEVFNMALASSCIAMVCGFFVKTKKKKAAVPQAVTEQPASEYNKKFLVSLDRFILIKGLPAGFNLFLLAIPYGMITTFIALYSEELELGRGTGLFFTCMAVGIILSRLLGGRSVDKGHLLDTVKTGIVICVVSIAMLAGTYLFTDDHTTTKLIFNASALLTGLGYGLIFPGMNTLFVNLARHNQRGTASATYMTTWDVGIGLGMLMGGYIGDMSNYSVVFLIGAVCNALSALFFVYYTKQHYIKNKLEGTN